MRIEAVALAGAIIILALASTPPRAAAEATLTLDPPAGPCNGTTTATGTGFAPNSPVELSLGTTAGDANEGTLAVATVDASGSFVVQFSFGTLGCDLLARTLRAFEPDHFTIYANYNPDDLSVFARVDYGLTTIDLPAAGSAPSTADATWPLLPTALALAGAGLVAVAIARRSFNR